MLYDAKNCPCLNRKCDLWGSCEECVKRHHASEKYPRTACEICQQEGLEQVHPGKFGRTQ